MSRVSGLLFYQGRIERSSNNFFASFPLTGSLKIAGYFPASFQAKKKYVQSINPESSFRSISFIK